MVAVILRSQRDPESRRLADEFCASAARRVRALGRALWTSGDENAYRLGREVADGKHERLERDILAVDWEREQRRLAGPARKERHSA